MKNKTYVVNIGCNGRVAARQMERLYETFEDGEEVIAQSCVPGGVGQDDKLIVTTKLKEAKGKSKNLLLERK